MIHGMKTCLPISSTRILTLKQCFFYARTRVLFRSVKPTRVKMKTPNHLGSKISSSLKRKMLREYYDEYL